MFRPCDGRVPVPFARVSRELWLSIFVLFYRISRWKGSMKANSAVAAPAILETLLALSALSWIEIALHQRIDVGKWLIGVFAVVIYWANSHVLVERGSGLKFEREFSGFARVKQLALFFGAVLVTVTIGFFLYFTVTVYRQTFGIR